MRIKFTTLSPFVNVFPNKASISKHFPLPWLITVEYKVLPSQVSVGFLTHELQLQAPP